MAITMGARFNHYEILAALGAGGMGEVYRARDTRLDREVAIKVLPASFANDSDWLKRFEQEARATSALNHPNILTVHDFGTHEGAPFIVAELLEGEELRAQLDHGALPVRKAIEYAQQVAAGLAAAHEKGIVHCDLKPENLFVTKDGRVVQRGDQLTLSLELVDISKDSVIWTEQYNRKQSDLVSLQSELARDVSTNLKAKLSGAEETKVTKTGTANPKAYQLYLKGRFYWNKRTTESLKQAVEFFNQAIEKDSNYALAYSGLAESYVLFQNYSVAPALDSMPKAKAAALRAIELDDSLAETHTALGIYYSSFAWNQPAAEKEFLRAIELNPNYAPAHQQYGNYCLIAMRRFDESIAEGKRAEELDPLSPIISQDVGANFTRARQFDEAIAQLNRSLSLDPNFYAARYALGAAYHAKGQYAEAIAEYRKALELSDDPWVKALLARSLAKSGQRDEAVKLLGELHSEATHRFVPSSGFAIIFAALGEKDKAFVWLEKEVAERSPRAALFSVNPLFDDLRDDPRFADLVRRVEAAKLD